MLIRQLLLSGAQGHESQWASEAKGHPCTPSSLPLLQQPPLPMWRYLSPQWPSAQGGEKPTWVTQKSKREGD